MILKLHKKLFFKVSEEDRDRIQNDSIGQFGNEIFESERRYRLTASMFGRVIKRRPFTPCHNIVKACLKDNTFWTEATEYGVLKEKVAIELFQRQKGIEVQPSGLWVDLTFGYLGASPDGKEIKYLFFDNTKFIQKF